MYFSFPNEPRKGKGMSFLLLFQYHLHGRRLGCSIRLAGADAIMHLQSNSLRSAVVAAVKEGETMTHYLTSSQKLIQGIKPVTSHSASLPLSAELPLI